MFQLLVCYIFSNIRSIVLVKLCVFESLWHFLFCHEGIKIHKVFIILKLKAEY